MKIINYCEIRKLNIFISSFNLIILIIIVLLSKQSTNQILFSTFPKNFLNALNSESEFEIFLNIENKNKYQPKIIKNSLNNLYKYYEFEEYNLFYIYHNSLIILFIFIILLFFICSSLNRYYHQIQIKFFFILIIHNLIFYFVICFYSIKIFNFIKNNLEISFKFIFQEIVVYDFMIRIIKKQKNINFLICLLTIFSMFLMILIAIIIYYYKFPYLDNRMNIKKNNINNNNNFNIENRSTNTNNNIINNNNNIIYNDNSVEMNIRYSNNLLVNLERRIDVNSLNLFDRNNIQNN